MYNLKGINPYVNVKLHWVDLHKAIVVENTLATNGSCLVILVKIYILMDGSRLNFLVDRFLI